MLTKRLETRARKTRLSPTVTTGAAPLDRRAFLRNAGVTATSLAAVGTLGAVTVQKAHAISPMDHSKPADIKKNLCTHCSVGCTVTAEVQNGVWVGQEPSWDSPINRGTHCAKGAAIREIVFGDRRLKYPMKLVDGQCQKISWEQALDEVGAKMMEIREKSGPESVWWLGSAKFTNEAAYLFRKFAAFWGTNSVDHQARICHSTTVAGVANTWGYGAQTNSLQRHPQLQDHDLHGRQPGRGASGVAAARAVRQGDQPRQPDRHRSAHDAHRGACHRVRAHPLRHRHPGDLGHAVAHLRERLGRQAVHRAARLRHGCRPRRSEEVGSEDGRGCHRRSRRAAEARRRDVRQAEARRP